MHANHIREVRQARGVPAIELAYKIGRSSGTLWRYETGEVNPPLATARRIADVLGATLDELFPVVEREAA